MLENFTQNGPLVWYVVAAAGFLFVATLVAVPFIVIRLPADYFAAPERRRRRPDGHRRVRDAAAVIAKNVAGYLLIAMGIAMLVLPGQGILTIVVGLMLVDFPGKYRLELWAVSREPVLRAINWIRARADRGPLQIADPDVALNDRD